MRVLIAVLMLGLLGGCACKPGHIGPYGAHPPRCWIW